jgi:hypothetical protein
MERIMTSDEQMRADFEVVAKPVFKAGASFEFDDKTAQYKNPFVQHVWFGWSLARQQRDAEVAELVELLAAADRYVSVADPNVMTAHKIKTALAKYTPKERTDV